MKPGHQDWTPRDYEAIARILEDCEQKKLAAAYRRAGEKVRRKVKNERHTCKRN